MLDKLCVWTFHDGCLWMSITVSETYVHTYGLRRNTNLEGERQPKWYETAVTVIANEHLGHS